MTITKIRTEITTLSYSDKIYLLQLLVQEIAKEESLSLKSEKHGQRAAEILRRMADRNALGNISEPVEWQREIRQDNVLDGRE
jgi:FtsZ-binding cell division protein ZapB